MSLDIDGLLADLNAAPQNSTFVLHTVAHNPSGVDPTPDQWKLIANVVKEKNAIPVFDTAYQVFVLQIQHVEWFGDYFLTFKHQGYASGDLDKDAWSVRYFAHELGLELMVTQSYSKNFGLYGEVLTEIGSDASSEFLCFAGERIGALNIVTKDAETAGKIRSQLNGCDFFFAYDRKCSELDFFRIIRPMYSNPQLHGARLVAAVVSDPALYQQWDA